MEFSILIPVYNFNVIKLVEALFNQAVKKYSQFEILCIDDCSELSSSYLNRKITQIDERISYEILSENIGRAAIRNLLFSKATFENCIVLDCDVSIIKNDFIALYLNQIQEKQIVMGGHLYSANPPKETNKYLHWLYGTLVETKSMHNGKMQQFLSSNFACKKSCFDSIQFDETLKEYGHEDTLLGIEAQAQNIRLVHIYNPVQHDGLEDAAVFLAKQQQAIENLYKLYKQEKYTQLIANNNRLIYWGNKKILPKILGVFSKEISKNLLSKKPTIMALQMQKILWWNEIKSHKN